MDDDDRKERRDVTRIRSEKMSNIFQAGKVEVLTTLKYRILGHMTNCAFRNSELHLVRYHDILVLFEITYLNTQSNCKLDIVFPVQHTSLHTAVIANLERCATRTFVTIPDLENFTHRNY